MKMRINSRKQIVQHLLKEREEMSASGIARGATYQIDTMLYMLADGKTVKVYEDRDMGGMVVEYDD